MGGSLHIAGKWNLVLKQSYWSLLAMPCNEP